MGLRNNLHRREKSIPKALLADTASSTALSQRSHNMQLTNTSLHCCIPSISHFFPTSHPHLRLRNVFLAICKRNGKKEDAKHRNKLSLFPAAERFGRTMTRGKKNVESDKSIYTYSKLHPTSQGTRCNGK